MIKPKAKGIHFEIILIMFSLVLLSCNPVQTSTPEEAATLLSDTSEGLVEEGVEVTDEQNNIDPARDSRIENAETEPTKSSIGEPSEASPFRIEQFSLGNLTTEIPDNILDEVAFGGAGGGSGKCGDTFAENNRVVNVVADGYIQIDTCYWDEEDIVTLVATSPDGQEIKLDTFLAETDPRIISVLYIYDPLEIVLGEPYRFQFSSNNKTTVIEATLISADFPVKGISAGKTVFYNFQPNEIVHVYYYEPFIRESLDEPLTKLEECRMAHREGFEFIGWQTFQADEKGRLVLEIAPNTMLEEHRPDYFNADHYLFAVGESSGEVYDPFIPGNLAEHPASFVIVDREQQKQACFAAHNAADQLIASLNNFLGSAVESKINALRFSDPTLAADFYAGSLYEDLVSTISDLDQIGAYAINDFDFENSYHTNESVSVFSSGFARGGRNLEIRTSVSVDLCELWTTSYYSKLDNGLLSTEPTRLVPQSIRIGLTDPGTWKITEVLFRDPPAFCTDIDPDLFLNPGPETMEIGRSASGQLLTAVRIGSGENVIILIGGLHAGFAPASVSIAEQAIAYFSDDTDRVPFSITMYIIPNANPDSELAPGELDGRLNANGVDLNRNWDCRWVADPLWRGAVATGTGGPAPFSEPETMALRDFIVAHDPVAVIFWEARASGGLSAPGACDANSQVSVPLAVTYGIASGYRVADFENLANQELNGDSTNWLDQQGIPAIAILLPDYDDMDWNRNLVGLRTVLDENDVTQ